jgi:hypothetical protein
MGSQDIIAILIAAGAAGYAIRSVWKMMNRGGCGSGCACGHSPDSTGQAKSGGLGIVRRPLVTLDQVGTPGQAAGPSPDRKER